MNNNSIKDILKKYIEYLDRNRGNYPISALDYSSLYPSLIMTYNLSPEYLVLDEREKERLEKKEYKLHKIEFNYDYEDHLEQKQTEKIIGWTVRYYKEEFQFGLYPAILQKLFQQRAEMKKELAIYKDKKEHMEKYTKDYIDNPEYKECLFKLKYCDTKQKALKVFMNTFYGEMGNKNSPLFKLPLAGGVTSAGQRNLLLIKDYVESLNHKVYYGDSVIGETPIIVRYHGNKIDVVYIKDLGWNKYHIWHYREKEFILSHLHNIEVYTENGWSRITKMIRHKTHKKLYRITTKSGSVVVTEDHSLLDKNKQKIKPEECNEDTELLTWENIKLNETHIIINPEYYMYCDNPLQAQKEYIKLKNLNYNVEIKLNYLKGYPMYKLIYTQNKLTNANNIMNIEFLGYSDDYVYDLETISHHFAAGIGNLVVHNTDSLYISCPDENYKDIDKLYYTNKISKVDYNNELINITFKAIEDIKNKVNNYLYQDNGTKFLKMAYEEVLYPLAFLSKKKYFGIPHENIPNFHPKDLFIRGLEVKKRGVSELLKIICMDIMWKSMSLENTKTLRELVEYKIKEIFNKKWNLQDFIQTGVWKPEKKNITLNNFAERMKAEGKPLPTPGERFNYVIIKKYPYTYDFKGRQKALSKADKMEYLDIVEKYNYDIDLKYYFDNQLTGQFARLISYDNEFEHMILNSDTNEYDLDDDKTINNCKKYILKLVDQYSNIYEDKQPIYKELYKKVNNYYKNEKNKIYKNQYDILLNSKKIDDKASIYEIIINNIDNYIKNKKLVSNNLINKLLKIKGITKIYNKKNISYYNQQQKILESNFNIKLNELVQLLNKYNLVDKIFQIDNYNLSNIIMKIRETTKEQKEKLIEDTIIEEYIQKKELYLNIDNETLNIIYDKYIYLISIKELILMNSTILEKIYIRKFEKNDFKIKPSTLQRWT
jgi:hypothetical protein